VFIVNLSPGLDTKVKQGRSEILLFFKIPSCITILLESSQRDFFIDMVVDRFILKITILRSPPVPPSYPKQERDYLKQGAVFTY